MARGCRYGAQCRAAGGAVGLPKRTHLFVMNTPHEPRLARVAAIVADPARFAMRLAVHAASLPRTTESGHPLE